MTKTSTSRSSTKRSAKSTNPLPRGIEKLTDVIQHPQIALEEIYDLRRQNYDYARKPQPTRLIVSGSRSITDYETVKTAIEIGLKKLGLPKPTLLIEGEAPGPDRLARRWAEENKIKVDPNPADWDNLGNKAGKWRNRQQAGKGEALIAIWDGESGGTPNQIAWCALYAMPIYVALVETITQEALPAKPVKVDLPIVCGKIAPASVACRLGTHCICVQQSGHTTPHRAKCGAKWANRKRS